MNTMTMADSYQRWYHWLALWLLVIACRDLSLLIAWATDAPANGLLQTVAHAASWVSYVVFAVAAFSLLFSQTRFLWSVKGPKDLKQRGEVRPDDFAFDVVRRAATIGWGFAMALIILPNIFLEEFDVPGDQAIRYATVLLAGGFSVAYFVLCFLNRDEG